MKIEKKQMQGEGKRLMKRERKKKYIEREGRR